MLSFNSALLSVACDFTSKFAPYQAVEITQAKNGGVYLASTDKGNIACFAYDPSGVADENFKDMDGNWFQSGYDQALMLPVLSLTEKRKYIVSFKLKLKMTFLTSYCE